MAGLWPIWAIASGAGGSEPGSMIIEYESKAINKIRSAFLKNSKRVVSI
jgi:hypothetical protein